MLIRSQNKEVLVNADTLAYMEIREDAEKTLVTCYVTGCGCVLGEYSSREKSMKVLDMIQEAYTNCVAINTVSAGLASSDRINTAIGGSEEKIIEIAEALQKVNIFQMPQDSEVE